MPTDIKAKNITSTAAASIGPARIKGIYAVCGAAAGSVSIKNGGSGGTELLKMDTPAGATLTVQLMFPGNGIRFEADPYVTLTNATSLTFFYG